MVDSGENPGMLSVPPKRNVGRNLDRNPSFLVDKWLRLALRSLIRSFNAYQPVRFEGRLLRRGKRDFEHRWTLIRRETEDIGARTFLDIGCAEGYYAVGLARLLGGATIYAHDLDPAAQDACRALAEVNGVADRVVVGGGFAAEDFEAYRGRRALVVCDIEGAERDLLDPSRAPSLAGFDILVELHDLFDRGVSAEVVARFAGSHDVERFGPGARDIGAFPELVALEQLDQWLGVWEWRSGPTPWAFMRARQLTA